MKARRHTTTLARLMVALSLLVASGCCAIVNSRTHWYAAASGPAFDVPTDSPLAAVQAQFDCGTEAEAACNPAAVDHYFAAATAAWPYHVAAAGAPHDPAHELYRSAVRQLIASAVKFGRFNQQQGITLANGQLLPIAYRGFLWQPCEFHAFLPVGSYECPRINNTYANGGVGVTYVVLTNPVPQRPFIKRLQPFAATAVLKPTDGPVGGGFALEFYDPLRVAATDSGLLLARDLTAPIAYEATQEGDSWLEGFLRPDTDPALEGLRMSQPFQPDKIPVVFVHGLASSPITWSNLENDLRNQPDIMARYQVWAFRYDTGDPFLSSAAMLRRQLAEIRQVYDPAHCDPNLSRMVLVGHSLGGLLSKLQVTYSCEQIWYAAAKQPFNTIVTDPATRADLSRAFFFGPSPDVTRVVYIATPHRGSVTATRCVGRVSSALVRDRPNRMAQHEQLVRDNPCAFREEMSRGIPTSVDLLEPSSPILISTTQLLYRPGVQLHSIIGDDGWTLSEGRTDGVVAVSSATLGNVQSEIIVPARHTEIQRRPETTQEVLRILRLHAAEGMPLYCEAAPPAARDVFVASNGALDEPQGQHE